MAHLADLTKIERLSIGGPDLTDEGLKYLSKMKNLNFLIITDGRFTDKGLYPYSRCLLNAEIQLSGCLKVIKTNLY